MNKESVKKSKQVLIGMILLIVVLIFTLAFFVTKPLIQRVYATKDSFEENKIKFEMIKQDAAQSQTFVDLVENLGRDQDLVEHARIQREAIVVFIQDVEKISKEVGNRVSISQLAAIAKRRVASSETDKQKAERVAQEKAEAKKTRLSLEVEGDYRDFLQFLYKLENMTYIFEIESVEIGSVGARYGGALRSTEETPIDFTLGKISISFVPKD